MADKRPKDLTTEETTFRGFVHSDDATNGSRKFDLARIGQALAPRLPATGYQFTGTGFAATQSDAVDLKTSDWFYRVRFVTPATRDSTSRTLITAQSALGTVNNRVDLTHGSGSYALSLNIRASATQSISLATLAASTAYDLIFTLTTAGNYALYLNGVSAASGTLAGSAATEYAAIPSLSRILVGNYATTGVSAASDSTILSAEYGNVALTAAEVAILTRYGWAGLPLYVHSGGAGAWHTWDFSSGVDGWFSAGAVVDGNIDGVAGVDNTLRLYASGGGINHYVAENAGLSTTRLQKRFRLKGRYYLPSANTTVRAWELNLISGQGRVATYAVQDAWTNIFTEFTLTAQPVNSRIFLRQLNASLSSDFTGAGVDTDDLLYFESGLALEKVGLCGRWVFDRYTGMAVPDLSGGSNPILLTSATGWLQGPSLDITLNQAVTHSGSGNLQFGGQSVIDTNHAWAIDSLVVESDAAVTWSLGTASGGSEIISGKSLSIGLNYIADADFVTRFLTGANLWSNSSGAATITIRAKLRKV